MTVTEIGKKAKKAPATDRERLMEEHKAWGLDAAFLHLSVPCEPDSWKGYKQKVTIRGEQVDYSIIDLQQEAQRHTHLNGPAPGHLTFLPSVDEEKVLKDLIEIRGITTDTLYKWLHGKMASMIETFNEEPEAQSWSAAEQGEFIMGLQELEQLIKLFQGKAFSEEK